MCLSNSRTAFVFKIIAARAKRSCARMDPRVSTPRTTKRVRNSMQTASINKWLVVITIMLIAILEVLDSTIVNVALPAMMPSLGADQEQITWVLTSYIVAAAMILPLTGFLTNRFGQKKLLQINIIGFMVSSVLCGMATNLTVMVLLRLCQGAFGATLIPTSQSVLRHTFPIEEQGKAMAIWGLGIMVAPVLGPTLGGFITEHTNWRWIFYINLPICLIGFMMTSLFITETKKIMQKIDWSGLLLLLVGIGALQIFLDQGNSKNWFDSNVILLLCLISIASLTYFIVRSFKYPNPIIKLHIFRDRNFTICTITLALFAGCVFSFLTLEPLMLEGLFNYTALAAGMTVSPMGIASAVTMSCSALLIKKLPVKALLSLALLLCAGGIFYLSRLDLNAAQSNFMTANALVGGGMGLFMVPLTTYSLITLPEHEITEGAGLYTYGRMLGTSIGISLLSTLLTREQQINWNRLAGYINPFSANLHHWLITQHLTLTNPTTYAMLAQIVEAKAGMVSFADAYVLIAGIVFLLIPLIFLLQPVDIKLIAYSAK